MDRMIIAIDGPAGSGKSTVCKLIANRLGILYVDTGAIYRALTLKALKGNIDLNCEEEILNLFARTDIQLRDETSVLRVYLEGEDVTQLIRTKEVTEKVKYVACMPRVREKMVLMQRRLGLEAGRAILEGRDISTVVFPDADYKFYLDADITERARRRYKDLIAQGYSVTFEEVKRDVAFRDKSDMERLCGPLKKAEDSIVIDTTNLNIEEVVCKILSYIQVGMRS